jgi:drug/metabolite transporter (DMT)-like permease
VPWEWNTVKLARAVQHPDNPAVAIICLTSGMAIITLQDVILKVLSDVYPVHQAITIRALVALPLLLLFIFLDSGLHKLSTRQAPVLLLRGAVMFSAYTAYYLGLASLPLVTCMALYFVAPIFVTIFASVFLGERVGPRRWSAVTIGFAGILIVLRPGGDFTVALFLPLFAGFAYAASAVMARSLAVEQRAPVMAFYGNGAYLLGGLLLASLFSAGGFSGGEDKSLDFLMRGWTFPAPMDLVLLAACGGIAAAGTVLLTQAYRIAQSSIVAPFEYTALMWGVAYGWIFWRDWPDTMTWLGIAIIIGCGLYILRRAEG